MNSPIIVGEKVYLRPLERGDMGLVTKWHNDPEIMRLFAFTKPTSEEYWLDWYDRMVNNPNVKYFGVAKKGNDELIGYVHLEQIYWAHKLCRDIGILIGEKGEWSKGYGTEAMRLLIDHAFNKLGLHRLELMTFPFNERGLRVWDKLGFKKEGIMRKSRYVDGEWHDLIFMALLDEEYEGG